MEWDEKIPSRLNCPRINISLGKHLTGQVGQAGSTGFTGIFYSLFPDETKKTQSPAARWAIITDKVITIFM